MRFLSPLLALCLLSATLAQAQEVTIPQTVSVAPGRLAAVEMTYTGDDFAYVVPPELDAFREYTTDPKIVRLRVLGDKPGIYQITAVAAKAVDGKGRLSPFKTCLVVVGQPTPKPEPTPTPPPGPAPLPPTPDPIVTGPRTVLIVRESAVDSPSDARMYASLQAGKAHEYLRSKGHACFVLDDDEPLAAKWNAALALPLPVLAILDDKGAVLFKTSLKEGATADDVLTVLKSKGG